MRSRVLLYEDDKGRFWATPEQVRARGYKAKRVAVPEEEDFECGRHAGLEQAARDERPPTRP